MSGSWIKKRWFSVRPMQFCEAGEPMNGGKPFVRCATLRVYSGEFKLSPELMHEIESSKSSAKPVAD